MAHPLDLLRRLATEGGEIVGYADCSTPEIIRAEANGRTASVEVDGRPHGSGVVYHPYAEVKERRLAEGAAPRRRGGPEPPPVAPDAMRSPWLRLALALLALAAAVLIAEALIAG